MQTIILDDHGREWDARSLTLRRLLHCPLPDFDFLSYLIENLGFVAVTKIAPNAARIRFRPETAAQASIAAALYRVADMGLERIVISHPDRLDRLFPNLAQAFTYIAGQVAADHQPPSPAFMSRERPIDTLANTDGPLSSLFAQWTDAKQVYDSSTLANTLIETLHARFMVVEPLDGRLTIVDVGSGFESYGKTWQEHARGLPIEEQPDYDYGRWVKGMFRSVQETRQPRLDEVDATIRRPHRNDRVRVRYQRLILPFTCHRHEGTCLLAASVIDHTIDLGSNASADGNAPLDRRMSGVDQSAFPYAYVRKTRS
jgi:hypothetical protein